MRTSRTYQGRYVRHTYGHFTVDASRVSAEGWLPVSLEWEGESVLDVVLERSTPIDGPPIEQPSSGARTPAAGARRLPADDHDAGGARQRRMRQPRPGRRRGRDEPGHSLTARLPSPHRPGRSQYQTTGGRGGAGTECGAGACASLSATVVLARRAAAPAGLPAAPDVGTSRPR